MAAAMRDPERGGRVPARESTRAVHRPHVTDDQAVERGVDDVIRAFGTIDVLVNKAGRAMLGAIESTTDAEMLALYVLNVFSLVRMTRAVLPVMRANNSGRIINIGSMGGVAAFAGAGGYASKKFAVEGLTEAMQKRAQGDRDQGHRRGARFLVHRFMDVDHDGGERSSVSAVEHHRRLDGRAPARDQRPAAR